MEKKRYQSVGLPIVTQFKYPFSNIKYNMTMYLLATQPDFPVVMKYLGIIQCNKQIMHWEDQAANSLVFCLLSFRYF